MNMKEYEIPVKSGLRKTNFLIATVLAEKKDMQNFYRAIDCHKQILFKSYKNCCREQYPKEETPLTVPKCTLGY